MRRRKTAFKINREDLNTKMSEYFEKGGEVEKIETIESGERRNHYNVFDPSLCGSGRVISRDYPEDYFL